MTNDDLMSYLLNHNIPECIASPLSKKFKFKTSLNKLVGIIVPDLIDNPEFEVGKSPNVYYYITYRQDGGENRSPKNY
ncbi:MAG: hypothetical protein KJ559_01530 [Nanoarchaeota archaeon]|nr:hypothetical protein [Nanoarchaeota archaeon]